MSNQLFHLLRTRQSAAELAIENKNEASWFAQYKWFIVGGLFAFILQVLAAWWFLKRRREKKARQAAQADEEGMRLRAKQFENVRVNGWGAGGNGNVWGTGSIGAQTEGRIGGGGVADVPPAYDGRREQHERYAGGKI